jgi:hypothetical protein
VINRETFEATAHGRGYLPVLDQYPAARDNFFAVLNEAESGQRLRHFQEAGFPALTGIAWILESDAAIVDALANSDRFHQAVGKGVAFLMEDLGWQTTGRKGPVTRSRHFGRAERYEPQQQ